MKQLLKKIIMSGSLLVLAAAPLSMLQQAAASALAPGETCSQSSTPVKLSATDPNTYQIAGWLCWSGTLQGKTVQFLEHGSTYDHSYFDWPQSPNTYSYVQTAVAQGYATFNIDRIGDGISSRPADPNQVNNTTESFVAHQLVQDLRSGTFNHTSFTKVISVGHSYGSVVALVEESTYHDVNGLVLTGLLHTPTAGSAQFATALYPANLDPKFAGLGLNSGYLTTVPGARGSLFYNTAFADPAVVTKDEQLKQTTTVGEAAGIAQAFDPSISLAVNVPVMLVVGQKDLLFCDESAGLSCANSAAVQSREAPDYAPAACLQSYALPQAGHSLNLHPDAQAAYAVIQAWALTRIGNGTIPPIHPCN